MTQKWVLLLYKIPPKPTSRRVYIWRKLKKIGALLWNDSAWILPATDKCKEHFQWIAAEIIEFQGEAQVWEAHSMLFGQTEKLVQQFKAVSDDGYRTLLVKLQGNNNDLTELSKEYQILKQQDYFNSELERSVRDLLLKRREEKR
jgi:hypothetical protein